MGGKKKGGGVKRRESTELENADLKNEEAWEEGSPKTPASPRKQQQGQGRQDDKEKKKNEALFQAQEADIVKWRTQNDSTHKKTEGLHADIDQTKQIIEDQKVLVPSLEQQAEDLKNQLVALRQ